MLRRPQTRLCRLLITFAPLIHIYAPHRTSGSRFSPVQLQRIRFQNRYYRHQYRQPDRYVSGQRSDYHTPWKQTD